MKEATGEVSMTVVTLVAIAVIGAILAFMWPSIKGKITTLWDTDTCQNDTMQTELVNNCLKVGDN